MALIKLQNTMIEEVEIPWNKPTLLKGFCRDMKAVKKWNDVSYLKTNFMNAKVDVEYYKTETDFETSISKIKSMRFNEYFDQMGDRTYVPDCSLFDMSDDISENILTDLINPNDVRIGLKILMVRLVSPMIIIYTLVLILKQECMFTLKMILC